MDTIQLLQKISEELSSSSVYEDFKRNMERLREDNVRLGILGQPNTAKTTLINSLVGTSLPVSNIPSNTNYTISVSDGSDVSTDGNGFQTSHIKINSKWLEDKKLTIKEIGCDMVPEETSMVDFCSVLSQCDCCVYLLNAQSPLSRTDLFVLKKLNEIELPAVLVLSKFDLIPLEAQTEVYDYVKTNISGFKNLSLIELRTSIKNSVEIIKSAIDSILNNIQVSSIRKNFETFYLTIAIGKLYEVCSKHIDECTVKKNEIEILADEKLSKLDEKSVEWLKIETGLRQRIAAISDKLREFLFNRKEDMLRRLSHDVDICGDIKLFWEKDFPYRLDEMVRSEMASGAQLVNQELIQVMQWLQNELLKQFKCKISLTTGIVADRVTDLADTQNSVSVTDTQKLKIITRIGTAATVIAAGALFATSGIGGIIMAVGMVSGISAECIMKKQINNSKEDIKKHLPEIVEKANLRLITEYETKMQNVTLELITHLHTVKADWFESSKKMIKQEKEIATFNIGASKWNSIMDRINQLSEILIN